MPTVTCLATRILVKFDVTICYPWILRLHRLPVSPRSKLTQLGTDPLFGNPTSDDFLSYAVAIMPTVPGANLNTSNIAGSTNCDLLVPVTYIDAGCMNSLPLLFTFYEPHHVQNQPPEAEDQDISVNANSPIKIKLEAKDPDDDNLKFVLDTKPWPHSSVL